MKEIRITRAFLKKPLNSVILLTVIYLFFEIISWYFGYKHKLIKVERLGGWGTYTYLVLKSMILPEVCTVLILFYLINRSHHLFNLHTVNNTLKSIIRYELYFLPVICLSFFAFNPITQTVRYFLEAEPINSWQAYWEGYIVYTYNSKIYFQYIVPVLLIGYLSINISLLKDYFLQQQQASKIEATEAFQRGQASSPLAISRSYTTATSPHITSLKGRNAQGELDFPVKDVYYFTIEERLYYAELAKGRYLISKTLNELEAELDSGQFFRIKRDYIVNRQAVLSYSHWENGKYVVRLNTPNNQDIVIPRTRMQELREWLQKENKELLEAN